MRDHDGKYNYYSLETLVKAKIKKAYQDTGDIALDTDKGQFYLRPEGDCCAHCFIADIDNSDALQDANIIKIENLEMISIDEEDYDVVDTWGHRIHTDKGICTIGMRVNHNGYYGGKLAVYKLDNNEVTLSNLKKLEDFC